MFSFNESLNASIEYFKNDQLAANVFVTKYALSNKEGSFLEESPNDMHKRIAKEFARIENKYKNPLSEKEIYNLLKDFKYIVPQGSPMSGIGNPYRLQSVSNCFVIESPYDSYGGILKSDQELVQIAKRRGGIGFDISNIRPKGMTTGNAARTTDGIEVFMDRFSNSCREVAQGGRRGALMLTISVHHPQVNDFIKIKRDITRVTGANISVRVTDEFMEAVKKNETYEQRWPVDSENPEVTQAGNATQVWEALIEGAHASAEPGVLFWDTATKMTPSDAYSEEGFKSVSTNPCGEIILSKYDSCRLMLVNLTSFIKNPWKQNAKFNFQKFAEVVQKAQRLMDDMIDLELEQIDKIIKKIDLDPETDDVKYYEKSLWHNIRQAAVKGRRTGLGITGLGDALAMIGVTYGSNDAIAKTEEIYKWLALNSYDSSIRLAKERGAFEVFDHEKEKNHPFIQRIISELSNQTKFDYEKHGRRNIANTTTAPAGSVSVLTQTTSGIEPAFMLHYTRRKKIANHDDDARIDFVDANGDKWQEYTVYHHGFNRWMQYKDETDPDALAGASDEELVAMSPYAGATANEIDWVAKVKMQAAAQKWVCHAISNTTNLPKDASIETVKKVYMKGWELGCKGVTVYRDGCRDGVLISNDSKKEESSPTDERENSQITYHSAPRRPKEMKCDIHNTTIAGEKWTILVGLLDKKPYEIIGGLSKYVEIPKKYSHGTIIKHPRKTINSKYDLVFGENGDEVIIKDIVSVFDNPNHSAFTRTISLTLRHGVPMQYVVEQLQKDKDADLFSFSKVIARVLKKYIADGTKPGNGIVNCNCESQEQSNIVYQEGCATCLTCGFGKCG